VNRLNNSWGTPRIEFDYGFNITKDYAAPLDAYRINIAPAVGFNLRDGVEIGTNINGSYLVTEHNITAMAKYGTRSGIPDFEVTYSTPLRGWDPQLTTSARAFRIDGFSGWQWNIRKTFDQNKSLWNYYFRQFELTTRITSIRVDDSRYLGNTAEWNTTRKLDAGFLSLQYYENFSWGRYFLRLEDEFGLPTSSFSYSKLTAEARISNPLFFGIKMNWRVFSGSSAGTVPAQTAYSFIQATPLERFDSWLFRTPVFDESIQSHLIKPGGGNMFLTHDTTAANILVTNVALTSGNLVLFGDAGTLWNSVSTSVNDVYYDAGIGYQIFWGNPLPQARIDQIVTGLFFPLWIKDPSRPTEKEFAYRWRLIIGVRF
jgi:hypothetical protein